MKEEVIHVELLYLKNNYSLGEPPHSKGNGKGKAKQRQYKSKAKAKQSEDKARERPRQSETARDWRCYCYQVSCRFPQAKR